MQQHVQQLSCPNCGAPILQLNPSSQTVVCKACNSYVAVGSGAPEVMAKGSKLKNPPKPLKLGQRGIIRDTDYFVMGRVEYQGWDDEDRWEWTEWMLGAADGRIFWLSYDDEAGFVLFQKKQIRAAFNPQKDHQIPVGDGSKFAVHERYPAKITGVEGELTWRGAAGDMLTMIEGAGGGKRYSIQVSAEELELYEGLALDEVDIARAFGDERWAKQSESKASRQLFYFFAGAASLVFACVGFVMAAIFWNSGDEINSSNFRLDANTPIVISLDIQAIKRPIMINVDVTNEMPLNTYAEIDMAVVSPDDEEADFLTYEFWHESGSDEDGYWEEQDYSGTGKFVPLISGQHEIEVTLGEKSGVTSLPIKITIYKNHVLPTWFIGYGLLTGIAGVLLLAVGHPKATGNILSALADDD